MKTKTPKKKATRRDNCEKCGIRRAKNLHLFTVNHKRVCITCGQLMIAEWSQHVRDAQAVLSRAVAR